MSVSITLCELKLVLFTVVKVFKTFLSVLSLSFVTSVYELFRDQ